jgi:5-(carboxyamino)imidazole ribonucleotide mutase
VAELADAPDSKSGAREGVWVRVPPSVFIEKLQSDRGQDWSRLFYLLIRHPSHIEAKSYISMTDSQTSQNQPLVGIIMGSTSDWPTMKHAAEMLEMLGVPYESKVVSAHRTPHRMFEYAQSAAERGLKVIIAGAGGAAHLPGMVAALTHLPVLGVPVESRVMKGQDSLLSIVQMPKGIPVGTLAIGEAGAANAGLLAGSIIAILRDDVRDKLVAFRAQQSSSVPVEPPQTPNA